MKAIGKFASLLLVAVALGPLCCCRGELFASSGPAQTAEPCCPLEGHAAQGSKEPAPCEDERPCQSRLDPLSLSIAQADAKRPAHRETSGPNSVPASAPDFLLAELANGRDAHRRAPPERRSQSRHSALRLHQAISVYLL